MGILTATSRSKRRAIAAVEFALVAPVFASILVAMFELNRGMMCKETLSNAVRKAARTAIQRDKGSTDAFTDAVNIMSDNGYGTSVFNPAAPGKTATSSNIGSVTITCTDPSGNSLSDCLGAPENSTITIQVSIPVSSVSWTSSFFLTNTMIESQTVVMLKQ